MQKSAPSVGKIPVAALFTLSCFGLLLFLWVRFGGPMPLKPESYRMTVYFPEATQLAIESDVRIGGVSVGKVKTIELAPVEKRIDGQDMTEAEIEIEPEFAPISSDAEAILRQKTLLGETYVELTSGTEPRVRRRAGRGGLARRRREQLRRRECRSRADPRGRHARSRPGREPDPDRRDLQRARRGDAHRLPALAAERGGRDQGPRPRPQRRARQPRPVPRRRLRPSRDPRRQKQELKGLVRDTGIVFDALSERDDELAGVITNSNESSTRSLRGGGAARDVPDLPDLRARDAGDAEPSRRVPGEHAAADRGPAAGRQRHQPDAAQRPPPLALAASLFDDLDELIDVSDSGLPGARVGAQRARSDARRARPVPRQPQPGRSPSSPTTDATLTDFLSNPPVGLSGTLTPRARPAFGAVHAAPARLHHPGVAGDLSEPPARQPRQRLHASARHAGRGRGCRRATAASRASTATTPAASAVAGDGKRTAGRSPALRSLLHRSCTIPRSSAAALVPNLTADP